MLTLKELLSTGGADALNGLGILAIGALIAFGTGLLALKWLFAALDKGKIPSLCMVLLGNCNPCFYFRLNRIVLLFFVVVFFCVYIPDIAFVRPISSQYCQLLL